jgi:hypothetical protein
LECKKEKRQPLQSAENLCFAGGFFAFLRLQKCHSENILPNNNAQVFGCVCCGASVLTGLARKRSSGKGFWLRRSRHIVKSW